MAALVFLPVLVMAKVGLDTLGYYGCMYNAQPKSLSVIGMLIGLGLAAVALYAVVFYFFRLSIIFSTYALAFIMQGKGIGESISKGTKLFNAHWAYTAGLMTLFAVIAIGLEYSADHLFALTRHEWINEVKGFALSTLLLLYCALFFSYHKRVSKVPTSR